MDKLQFLVLINIIAGFLCAFSALTPLVGHKEEHPACKN